MALPSSDCRKRPSSGKLSLVVSAESRSSSETEKSWLLRPSYSDESRDSEISNPRDRQEDDCSISAPLLAPYDDIPDQGCLCLPRFKRERKSPRFRVSKPRKAVEPSGSTTVEKPRQQHQHSPAKFQKLPLELTTISMASLRKCKVALNELETDDDVSDKIDTTDDELSSASDRSPEQHHIGNYATVVWCRGFDRKCSHDDNFCEESSERQLSTLYEEDEETETDISEHQTIKDENSQPQKEKPDKLVEYLRKDDSISVCSGISRMSSVVLSIAEDFEEVWAQAGEEEIEIVEHLVDTQMPGRKVDQVLATLWSNANQRDQPQKCVEREPDDQPSQEGEMEKEDQRQRQPRRDSMHTTGSVGSIFTEGVGSIFTEGVGSIVTESISSIAAEGVGSVVTEGYSESNGATKISPQVVTNSDSAKAVSGDPAPTASNITYYPIPCTDSDSVGDDQEQSLLHKNLGSETAKSTTSERHGIFWITNLTRRSFRPRGSVVKQQPGKEDSEVDKSSPESYKELPEDKDELWYYQPLKSYPSIEDLPKTVWRGGEWRLTVDLDSVEVEAVTRTQADAPTALLMYKWPTSSSD